MSELLALLNELGLEGDDRGEWITWLQLLDAEYLKRWVEKDKTERKKKK